VEAAAKRLLHAQRQLSTKPSHPCPVPDCTWAGFVACTPFRNTMAPAQGWVTRRAQMFKCGRENSQSDGHSETVCLFSLSLGRIWIVKVSVDSWPAARAAQRKWRAASGANTLSFLSANGYSPWVCMRPGD